MRRPIWWLAGSSLLAGGCWHAAAMAPPDSVGKAQFTVPTQEGRQIQYVAADVNAFRVTIMDADNGNAVITQNTYSGAALATHLIANKISFEVDNLKVNDGTHPVYHYSARVDTFLDAALTTLIGTSTTAAPFTLTAGATANVTFPTLTLAPTPFGNGTATGSNGVTVVDTPAPAIIWK